MAPQLPTSSSTPQIDGAIALEGSSTGAAMSLQLSPASNGQDHHCCCINIYVNNNVQGATNSVLSGSRVVMRDSGVRFYLPRHRGGATGPPASSRKRQKRWRRKLQNLERAVLSLPTYSMGFTIRSKRTYKPGDMPCVDSAKT
ncbi:hypothetical protein Taro_005903 [Colocasia esculenta]|uniref:Uncharacterized protein n=1 Tax=Colocasia esculenta TaxID=4460 RepID=A0A843TR76_COLES|nr:hypothetical protein [Colocasia esculenta]